MLNNVSMVPLFGDISSLLATGGHLTLTSPPLEHETTLLPSPEYWHRLTPPWCSFSFRAYFSGSDSLLLWR